MTTYQSIQSYSRLCDCVYTETYEITNHFTVIEARFEVRTSEHRHTLARFVSVFEVRACHGLPKPKTWVELLIAAASHLTIIAGRDELFRHVFGSPKGDTK